MNPHSSASNGQPVIMVIPIWSGLTRSSASVYFTSRLEASNAKVEE